MTDRAEEENFIKPKGIHNSFRAFLRIVLTSTTIWKFFEFWIKMASAFQRYVTQEDGERHLNPHWRSISYMCQPCRVSYQYIMDIETSLEDSAYVFKQLNFNTSLPGSYLHTSPGDKSNSAKTKKNPKKSEKQLEDYYKTIPKDLIKKVYAKYYLDFILFGFSSSMVSKIVNSGIDEPSNYTHTSEYLDNSIPFRNSYQFFLWIKSNLDCSKTPVRFGQGKFCYDN